MKLLLGILALQLTLSCSSQKPTTSDNKETKVKNFNDATKIVYHFRDSSVPPKYHRSTTYTVTPTKLRFVVDSYGDVIKDVTVDITPEHWKRIVEAANKAGLQNKDLSKEGGCTGGTGRRLTIHNDSQALFEGSLYLCGGSTSGDMVGDYQSVQKAMTNGIDPNVFMHD